MKLLQTVYSHNMIKVWGELKSKQDFCPGGFNLVGTDEHSYIHLGWRFFHEPQYGRVGTLIHEAFHAGDWSYRPGRGLHTRK